MSGAWLLLFHAGVAVFALARTATAVRRLRSLPLLEAHPPAAGEPSRPDPLISIVIPARDEAHNLPACLERVLAQQGVRLQTIIVDDHSQDRTLEIAREAASRDPRVVVLRGGEPPAGWVGKAHALHQGVGASKGEWLLFLDADVRLAPAAAATALAFATARSTDLLSLSPLQAGEGFWERLLQPFVFDLLNERYDLRAVNDPLSPAAAANGQFILIRRGAYQEIGGHEAIKTEVLDDVALARRAKQAGFRLYFANTSTLATTRMYRGLAEIWRGWTKNLFLLLGASHFEVWRTVFRELLLWVAPFGTLLGALLLSGYNGPLGAAAVLSGALAVACLVGGTAGVLSRLGGAPGYAALLPLGKLILVAMILASWYRHVTGKGISWKGRVYRG